MVHCVRGPTRRWLMNIALWLGLVMGAGCASDPDAEELDEAVSLEGEDQQADVMEDSYADSDSAENIYDDLNVEQASQGENYSYDNMDVGEGDNYGNLENNLAEDSYNLDSEDSYNYDESAQGDNSYNEDGYGATDTASEYGEDTYGNPYGNVQADDYQQVLNESTAANAEMDQGSDMLADNDYGAAINSYNDQSAMAALDAAGEYDSTATSMDESYGASMDATVASDGMMGAAVATTQTGLPELGSKMNYLVRQGDTLGSIATMIYGDKERWQEIQMLTGLDNPNLIYPGDVVYYLLSEESQAFAAAYENTAKGEVTIAQGDTLSVLAQSIYGDQSQWKTLWRANDTIDDPDKLTPGQTVYFVNYENVLAAQAVWQGFFAQQATRSEREAGEARDEVVAAEVRQNILAEVKLDQQRCGAVMFGWVSSEQGAAQKACVFRRLSSRIG